MSDAPGIRLDDLVDAAITKAALRDIGLLGSSPGRGNLSLTIDKDGALEIVERSESGIAVCAWGASPQISKKLIRRLEEQVNRVAFDRYNAAHLPPPYVEPKWRRCKLTPRGYIGGRSGTACARRRGHAGKHKAGTLEFTVECPHFGMWRMDGSPVEPTCPWCHVELKQERRA